MKNIIFGIIDKIKFLKRKKLMNKKNYLVQVDTTESTTRNGIPPGILNTFIVRANDPIDAKQTILRIYNRGIAEQIQSSLYVYEIEDIIKNLANIDEKNGIPLFSFMPLQGGRPPRQADVAISSLGNDTIPANQPQVQPPRLDNITSQQNPRSREFSDIDQGRPPTTDKLTPEQEDLVRRLGARPLPSGSDERINPRIAAATGLPPINREQQEILSKFGINPANNDFVDPELEREIQQVKGMSIEDPNLLVINETPLDEEALKALENELDKGIEK